MKARQNTFAIANLFLNACSVIAWSEAVLEVGCFDVNEYKARIESGP